MPWKTLGYLTNRLTLTRINRMPVTAYLAAILTAQTSPTCGEPVTSWDVYGEARAYHFPSDDLRGDVYENRGTITGINSELRQRHYRGTACGLPFSVVAGSSRAEGKLFFHINVAPSHRGNDVEPPTSGRGSISASASLNLRVNRLTPNPDNPGNNHAKGRFRIKVHHLDEHHDQTWLHWRHVKRTAVIYPDPEKSTREFVSESGIKRWDPVNPSFERKINIAPEMGRLIQANARVYAWERWDWSFDIDWALIGETADHPLPPSVGIDVNKIIASPPLFTRKWAKAASSSVFDAPIKENAAGDASPIFLESPLFLGHLFTIDQTNRFKSFVVPNALPRGDHTFDLAVGENLGDVYSLRAGDTFDFTTINPDGLSQFALLGIDESELTSTDDAPPSLVSGLTFMSTQGLPLVGITELAHVRADFRDDGRIDGKDLTDPSVGWQPRFGTDLDGSDFLNWQREVGEGPKGSLESAIVPILGDEFTIVDSAPIPEPCSVSLCCVATQLFYVGWIRFWSSRSPVLR